MLAPAPTRLSTHAIWCHVLSKATRVEKRSTVVDPRMYSFTVPSVGDRVPIVTSGLLLAVDPSEKTRMSFCAGPFTHMATVTAELR
jgi:hypothetical protein